jgi:hypothetical protein
MRNNDPQSAYAAHILNNIHEYGSTNNMSLLKQVNKGPHMNCLEQFYSQLYAHNTKLVPEQNPAESNPIFSFVYNLHSRLSPAWHWPSSTPVRLVQLAQPVVRT